MNKIKTIKVKNEDGSISEESYSIAADAVNVDMVNGKNVQETIGTIDVDKDGDIATQLNKKINKNDIIDNLDSTDANKVLSAKQGKVLNEAVAAANLDIQKKMYYFNTIEDMKEADLQAGDTCQTLGYYSANDGGAGLYKIVSSTAEDDGGSIHILDNGLRAELIIEDGIINVMQFGAKGNGVDDDTDILQKAIDYSAINNLKLIANSKSTYLISKTINITSLNTNFDFQDCTFKTSENFIATNDCMFYVNIEGGNHTTMKRISHFNLDCNYQDIKKAFHIEFLGRCFFEYIHIKKCFNKALYIKGGFETFYQNIFMSAIDLNISDSSQMGERIGIEVLTDDLHFKNITGIDFSTFLSLHDTSNYFEDVHGWIWSNYNLKNSKYAIIEKGIATLVNCYADTYENVLCASQESGNYKCSGLKTFFNAGFFENIPSDLDMHLFYQINNMNNYYYFKYTSIKNSIFNAHNNYHYKLSNTTKTLLADIDNSNKFTNIDNLTDINYANATFVDGVTSVYNKIYANNGITNVDIFIRLDISQVPTTTDYKIGNITNYKLAPKSYEFFYCLAENIDNHTVYNCACSIDQSGQNTGTSGQIRLRITDELKNAGVSRFIIKTNYKNVSCNI